MTASTPSPSAAAPAQGAAGPGRRRLGPLQRSMLALLLVLTLLLGYGAPASAAIEEAVLAGGCFWCLEHDLEGLPGVLEVESGYSGGKRANPTYAQVSAGGTGHQESVRVRFDSTRLRYEVLLRAYWRNIDPFDGGGQFCDRGDSYRPVIFTTNATQAVEARNSLVAAARELGRPTAAIKVAVRTLSRFWPAESYHQNYARRNGVRYRYYRWACRRDQRLDRVWGERARRSDRWANAAPAPGPQASASQGTPASGTLAPLPLAAPSTAPAPAPSASAASGPAPVASSAAAASGALLPASPLSPSEPLASAPPALLAPSTRLAPSLREPTA
jgi:peptide-methionine (S)-S-oxide reductase